MFEPKVPLIPLRPAFRNVRLMQIELGRLVLARNGAGRLGVRADALSAGGEISEGIVRFAAGSARFERVGLDEVLTEVEIDYEVEADLASLAVRIPAPGDLLVTHGRPAAGLFLETLWGGTPALLELGSATVRPFVTSRGTAQIACGWRMRERGGTGRVLYEHVALEEQPVERGRRAFAEDCD
ncbi:MAG: hypothetical protein JSS29_10735 [Proteobacteria bacterium]|nr:hypothetical protein [Pseudomonadota bacterium]